MKVSKLIHDLHEEIDEVRKQNVGLRNANEIYSKQNIDLRKNQDQDDLNRQITELKKDNNLLKEAFKDVKKDSNIFKKDNHNAHMLINDLKKENVRLVAQLENDEHNVGHLDEKMKRLAYLEKIFSENRYVFSDIPNTPENMKMVKMMKKYINKRKYTMRWRGQYLIDGEDWRKYTDGQPLSKSKCIRVYIDNKAYSIDNVEGFNANEVGVILDGLHKKAEVSEEFIRSFEIEGEENGDVDDEKRILDVTNQLYKYFESMRLHLENSASKPIKDNVNIVIPKGDKQCHTT
jgi:predicted RNase H-like nuclease (RuvC/YqgF family)